VDQPGEDAEVREFKSSDVRELRGAKVRSYPTREYLGLIFGYFGEGEPAPFRQYADMDEPGVLEACLPEYWPCNYFNRIDNACDLAHVAFTHREALRRVGRLERLSTPPIKAEETDYGIHMSCDEPPHETHFHMPNINLVRAHGRVEGSLDDAATFEVTRISWRVPVDDENTVSLSVDLTHVAGEEAERYRRRRKETEELGQALSPPALGEAILAGKLREKDLDRRLSTATLFSVEDYLMQVGQGALDRSQDRLGRIDVGVFLLRKIWQRELKTLAEGGPIKRWGNKGRIMSPVRWHAAEKQSPAT
jgi:5,5'-dehydrodivanillate O-demethylase